MYVSYIERGERNKLKRSEDAREREKSQWSVQCTECITHISLNKYNGNDQRKLIFRPRCGLSTLPHVS